MNVSAVEALKTVVGQRGDVGVTNFGFVLDLEWGWSK